MKQAVMISSLLMGGVLLAACQPASDNKPEQNSTASATVSATVASVQSPHQIASVAVASTVFPQTAENGMPKQINWALVDSGVKPVDKASFKYPFALDSEPVKAYAEMYHVDNETSRYNLTVGMEVNEVLFNVLDQLANVIHTTQQIAPSQYTYVFAEPFAKGLTIPVKIINDGKK